MNEQMNDPWRIDVNKESMGGTELLCTRLFKEFGDDLEPFQIIPSRVRELKPDKIRILYLHDLAGDPENKHLNNEGWKKFHKLVFVSYHQREEYLLRYGIPPSKTCVMHNSIIPIDVDIDKKSKTIKEKLNIIYHTTPHRGLAILVPVFKKIVEEHSNIHLDVFSSFSIYGWKERDEQFEPLFDEIRKNSNMTYHGFVSNEEIREKIKESHIFAYPNIWVESSCLSLIEAMSAGVMCVHPNLGALPETASNWTMMYNFHEDVNMHANRFYAALMHAINILKERYPATELKSQKSYMDLFYSWELRKLQWQDLFNELKSEYQNQSLDVPSDGFTYRAI